MRDVYDKLKAEKVTVFGLSADQVEKQLAFAKKEELPYDLVADPEAKIAKALGVPTKFGKFFSRQAFLFKDGKLIWKDESASTKGQGEEVLEAIKNAGE